MKILAVADEKSRSLWDFYTPDKLEGIDLIISCGDLSPKYLEFLVTLGNCPLLYVRGNHDGIYDKNPPEGCICIENMIYNYRGLRIAGLGGSMRYRSGPDMYTEKEMRQRVKQLEHKVRYTGGVDLLVTHAPVQGYGDLEDLPHRGFASFERILLKYRPLYMLHGHVHKSYVSGFKRVMDHPSGTQIINASESYMIEIPKDSYPSYGKTGSRIYDWECRIMTGFGKEARNPI